MSIPAQFQATISGVVVGGSLDVDRTVDAVPKTNPLTDAYLRVYHAQGEATPLITKHITTAVQAGVGQITDNGATSGTGQLVFQLVSVDTTALVAGWSHHYAIELVTADARVWYWETGSLTPVAP